MGFLYRPYRAGAVRRHSGETPRRLDFGQFTTVTAVIPKGPIMRRASAMLSITTLAALALVGCTNASETGGSGATTAGATGVASFDPSSIAKDATIAAELPGSIAAKGTLTIGSDTSYKPAEYLDPKDGQTPIGYDVDLAKAIAAVLGVKADVQTANFDGILPALGSKYDLGISSFTITPERTQAVDFVSYFKAGEAFAVKKGNPEKLTKDTLCGKNLGVQTGTTEADEVPGISKACTDAGKAAVKVVTLAKQSDVTSNLVNGKVDAMFADSPIIADAIASTNGQLEQLGDVQASAVQGIAVKKGDTQLAGAVQQAVQKLMDDGDYQKILDAWGNESGAIAKAEINPAAE